MLYLLEFKMDKDEEYYAESNANDLNYFYTQELQWTNGHFIVESLENGFMRTLIAYPHVEDPCKDLVDIQAYLLQKLNVSYKKINFMKFITRGFDEINIKCEVVDSLIIKCLSQDCFFNKIQDISIKRNSSYIAAIFFKNYFYEGHIGPSPIEDKYETSDYNKIKLKVQQNIENFYNNHEPYKMPIFIVNTHNKDQYIVIKQAIFEIMKVQSRLELSKQIYTKINCKTLINVLHDARTDSFIHNILGQIWDFSLDLSLNYYNSSKMLINESLQPVLNNNKFHSLIIIHNENSIPLDMMDFDNITIL